MNILLYGLQRSGTNLLEFLLEKNYQVCFINSNKDRSSPLQKHCRLYKNKKIIPEPQYYNEIFVDTFEQFQKLFEVAPNYYLVISKDPYSWYLSYKDWSKRCEWPKVTHHYIEEYNLFYKKFIDLSAQSDKFFFVRYVDLLGNVEISLNKLEKKMKLKKNFFSRLRLKKPEKVSQSDNFSENKIAYYLNKEYLRRYSVEEIKIINELLDPQVISFLGYELHEAL